MGQGIRGHKLSPHIHLMLGVKDEWRTDFISPQYILMVWRLIKHKGKCKFYILRRC
jgi:hypothetical protein